MVIPRQEAELPQFVKGKQKLDQSIMKF